MYCTLVDKFAVVNTVYTRYFPAEPPARVFVRVAAWPGTFDEVDCVATCNSSLRDPSTGHRRRTGPLRRRRTPQHKEHDMADSGKAQSDLDILTRLNADYLAA